MMRFAVFGLVALAACGGPVGSDEQPALSDRPALDFSGTASADGMGEDSVFARSVSARYGAGVTRTEIIADVQAQGFSCDADQISCTRATMEDACAIAWIVDIESSGVASGRHVKRCMGAEE
jgi:hypothetical protein